MGFFSQPPPPAVKPQHGMSAVISGMLAFYILKYRNMTMMFFFIPMPAYAVGGLVLGHALFLDRSQMQLGGILGGAISFLALRGL
jgi:membrane associated rhomboid family serine protease